MRVTPGLSFRAKMDMSLRLTTVHENARSAVECGSLLPLSLRPACWPWKGIPCLGERGVERARGTKAAASCRTPKRLRRLTPVFSIEASPIFMAAKDLLLVLFDQETADALLCS